MQKSEELSDEQIDRQFRDVPKFGRVYNKADLHTLGDKAYVFNLDDRMGPGSHWVALSNMDPLYVYYFDSFGGDPPEHIEALMKKTGKRYMFNTKQVQDIRAVSCGLWCIMFIQQLLKGNKPATILSWFTKDTRLNELKLDKYFQLNRLLV